MFTEQKTESYFNPGIGKQWSTALVTAGFQSYKQQMKYVTIHKVCLFINIRWMFHSSE